MFQTREFHAIIVKEWLLKSGKLSLTVENQNFYLVFAHISIIRDIVDITTARDLVKSEILKRFHHYNLWMSSNYWSGFLKNVKRSFMAEHKFLQSFVDQSLDYKFTRHFLKKGNVGLINNTALRHWGVSLHLLWLMWEKNFIKGLIPCLTTTEPSCMLGVKIDIWFVFILNSSSAGVCGINLIGWCHRTISGVCLILRSCLVCSSPTFFIDISGVFTWSVGVPRSFLY